MKTLLHVGCGPSRISNLPSYFHDGQWSEVRYDINPDVAPDIVGELQDMSIIEDGVIDAIYSSHNIEHVWDFEVPRVLEEFTRVLAPSGFALILCPDIMAVCETVVKKGLQGVLYESPAGPISVLDIMYGHQNAIANGNLFMAHRTAFTSSTLADALLRAGFSQAALVRDSVFGLHALAFKSIPDSSRLDELVRQLLPYVAGSGEVELYIASA